MKINFYLILVLLIIINSCSKQDSIKKTTNFYELTQYVNPFIGTGGVGHTFPGATRPLALVQLSPDTETEGWDHTSGYHYNDSTIIGFSHTHLSGTGGSDLGDILIMPMINTLFTTPGIAAKPDSGYRSRFSHNNEFAEPGYYKVLLQDDNILAELTSTQRCGFHRYTFPKADSTFFILDLGHGMNSKYERTANCEINIENDSTISGHRISSGWAPVQYIYFVLQFSKPFNDYRIKTYWGTVKQRSFSTYKLLCYTKFNTLPNEQILVKVGISTTSTEAARKNLFTEIPHWNFDKIHTEAKNEWNQYLNKIIIEGTQKQKEIFYSALYHSFIAPNNITNTDGTYRGSDFCLHKSNDGNYFTTFSLWDTYRATHPLYTILIPNTVGSMINSMLQHFEHKGILPIWTLWGTENYCMIGNHSIPVIVDAYLKGIKGFDVDKAYNAIKTTSTKIHRNSPWDLLNKYCYIPYDLDFESVSKTLELTYNDACVAMFANSLNKKNDYQFFYNRSMYYKNLFDNSTGFFRPRNSNGKFLYPFNPYLCGEGSHFTEANAWQYNFYVPHDIQGMIALYGSTERFNTKLDSLFNQSSEIHGEQQDITGLIGQYAHGNEPSHHAAYIFSLSNRPDLAQKYIAKICNELYNNTPDGLCGNEDCGQMSSWYIFSVLGFYPLNPCGGEYIIGTPSIPKAIINLPNGKTFIIIAENLLDKNCFIQSIELNGKPYKNFTLHHSEIMKGGTLKFIMSDKSNY